MTATEAPAGQRVAQTAVNVLKAYETQLAFPALTLSDRCDACNQRAVAQVKPDPTRDNLKLCGHHFRASVVKFKEAGYPYEVEADEATVHTFRSWETKRDNSARDAGSV